MELPISCNVFFVRRIYGCVMLALVASSFGVISAGAQDYGDTHFENSGSPDAQEPFIRGLLMLHSFEYDDAREAFREAQRLDPDFAMAYWGDAMTYNHPVWFSQDRPAAIEALKRLGSTPEERLSKTGTARERDYLRAVHVLFGDGEKENRDDFYAAEMARLAAAYPDDLDAAAFHALSILGTSHEGRDFATYMRAAAVAEEIFAANPKHPGAAHYLIHSYDDPIHAPLGLRAARAYAEIAPSAAHARHMPSHIFVALGMWDDVVRSNEASWAASEQRVAEKRLGVNDRGFHALLWLTYGYLQQGRYDDGTRFLTIMQESHEEANSGRTAYHLARTRAAFLIETEEWEGPAAELEVDTELLSTESGAVELFARGLASLRTGDVGKATTSARAIQSLEGFDDDDNDARRAAVMARQLDGLIAYEQGDTAMALETLHAAAEMEASLPIEFGPPSPPKPSYELLGEVLLKEDRVEEAAAAFQNALELAPGRVRSLAGLAASAEKLGRHEQAAALSEMIKRIREPTDPSAGH